MKLTAFWATTSLALSSVVTALPEQLDENSGLSLDVWCQEFANWAGMPQEQCLKICPVFDTYASAHGNGLVDSGSSLCPVGIDVDYLHPQKCCPEPRLVGFSHKYYDALNLGGFFPFLHKAAIDTGYDEDTATNFANAVIDQGQCYGGIYWCYEDQNVGTDTMCGDKND